MGNNDLIKFQGGLLKQVGNAISLTNKLLALGEPQLIPYRKGNNWGFCNLNKEIAIDCLYKEAFPFSENLAVVVLNNGYEYIDESGFIITNNGYEWAGPFNNKFALIVKNKKFGIINNFGLEVIKPIYDYIKYVTKSDTYNCKKFIVKLDKKEALFDLKGNQITDFKYDSIENFVDGYANFRIGNLFGILDDNGLEVIPCIYNSARVISRQFILVDNGSNYFYVNYKNQKVFTKNKEFAAHFGEGLGMLPDINTMKYGFMMFLQIKMSFLLFMMKSTRL